MKQMIDHEDTAKLRKLKAQLFLKNKTRAFIRDLNDQIYFCYITQIEEDYMMIYNFVGSKKGRDSKIYYLDIFKFEEYHEKMEETE